MENEVMLCKIASAMSDGNEEPNETGGIFEYKSRKWRLLPFVEDHSLEIKELIKYCDNERVKSFAFIELREPAEDRVYLVATYREILQVQENKYNYVMKRLFPIIFRNYHEESEELLEDFINEDDTSQKLIKTYITTKIYDALRIKHELVQSSSGETMDLGELKLPPCFRPKLCQYQERSVRWMLKREQQCERFPAYYMQLMARDDENVVYKHKFSHYMQRHAPPDIELAAGGILAEEMGLGKTVEMLALILLHPRNKLNMYLDLFRELEIGIGNSKRSRLDAQVFCVCISTSGSKKIIQCEKCHLWQHLKCVCRYNKEHTADINEPYLCPACWREVMQTQPLLKTHATFIVSPHTIKTQWLSEIRRHIRPSLRVLIYEGVVSGHWISPRQLADYDIVLTDYNTLRYELYYTQVNSNERTMRNKPRFIRVNTPLLMLEWWRVCLDEAQMVESNTSRVSILVRMLPAVNRWAVTGTPIQRSLYDLHSLLEFIGFEEVAELSIWRQLVHRYVLQSEPCSKSSLELIDVLQKCMWRTCKSQIVSELNVPPQQELVHRIDFNNLEKLFYTEQHKECRMKFVANVHKYTEIMRTISPQIMKKILKPFLKIRQTCTMPVVITSTANTMPSQKQFLQPDELHAYLKSTNELCCKSELRTMASSHNGLAALHILRKNYDEASKHYKAVLKLARDYNEMNVTVDSLLQIHALHNIMQIPIIKNNIEDNLPTQMLKNYEEQLNALEWKYLGTYAARLNTAQSSYQTALSNLNTLYTTDFTGFLGELVHILSSSDKVLLLMKIHEDLQFSNNAKLREIRTTEAVLYIVDVWLSKTISMQKSLMQQIEELKFFIDNVRSRSQVSPAVWRNIMQLVNGVYDCHLSEIRKNEKQGQENKSKQGGPKCKLCCIRDHINNFECQLFDKVVDEKTHFTDGLENPSFEICLVRVVFNFAKLRLKNTAYTKTIDDHNQFLETLQTVCKRSIKLWIEMEYTIKAYDELNMCKMRISLAANKEDKSNFEIFSHEIDDRFIEQENNLFGAQRQFALKLARLRYIKHLEEDMGPRPCPICHLAEDDKYAVLECGHHICFPCLKSICHYTKSSNFKCSICRNLQNAKKIYFVTRSSTKCNEDDIIVKGNYSSKITFIVRLILRLNSQYAKSKQQQPDGGCLKILIFSQWEPILQTIAAALKENDVLYRLHRTPRCIEKFKNLNITCLLMQLTKGSKGLNLVEATHVFLVEPILNPGEELQAIGRVHRFGQTKPTTVHRFIMNGTIEENIHNFNVSTHSEQTEPLPNWEFNNMSLEALENLFTLKDDCICE